jgi:hypothetical protein
MANCNCGCESQSFVRVRYQEQPPKCVARTVYHTVPQPPLKIIDTYEKVSSIVHNPCTPVVYTTKCCGCGCGCGH